MSAGVPPGLEYGYKMHYGDTAHNGADGAAAGGAAGQSSSAGGPFFNPTPDLFGGISDIAERIGGLFSPPTGGFLDPGGMLDPGFPSMPTGLLDPGGIMGPGLPTGLLDPASGWMGGGDPGMPAGLLSGFDNPWLM